MLFYCFSLYYFALRTTRYMFPVWPLTHIYVVQVLKTCEVFKNEEGKAFGLLHCWNVLGMRKSGRRHVQIRKRRPPPMLVQGHLLLQALKIIDDQPQSHPALEHLYPHTTCELCVVPKGSVHHRHPMTTTTTILNERESSFQQEKEEWCGVEGRSIYIYEKSGRLNTSRWK